MSNTAKKPFSYFFNQYFQDELGEYPRSTGRVCFTEALNTKDYSKVMDIVNKLEIYHSVDVILDTTITGNKKEGIYISASGDISIKKFLEDIEHKHVDKVNVRFYDDDQELTIGGINVRVFEECKIFSKRFVECVKSYKNQDEPAPTPKITIDTSKSDLDDMEARVRELEAGLK